jgi:hypothetical protein
MTAVRCNRAIRRCIDPPHCRSKADGFVLLNRRSFEFRLLWISFKGERHEKAALEGGLVVQVLALARGVWAPDRVGSRQKSSISGRLIHGIALPLFVIARGRPTRRLARQEGWRMRWTGGDGNIEAALQRLQHARQMSKCCTLART